MISVYAYILAKGEERNIIPLTRHLIDVAGIAVSIAHNAGISPEIVRKGALLHDIGKVSPIFQATLKNGYKRQPCFVWRHEIASLFFIQLFPKNEWPELIDMIVAHHKSICNDSGEKGLLDLEDNSLDCFERHAEGLNDWGKDAVNILSELGLQVSANFTIEKARQCYDYAIEYCENKDLGYSLLKGVIMAADHMASALEESSESAPELFKRPNLDYYNRQNELYPLSLIDTSDARKHTLVTAPTGAGKTDFLMRRCRGRVFYTLPYQASINAMYDRFVHDLANTGACISLLHSSSKLKIEDGDVQESIMQRMVGSSVKVLTPHQMASIVFGIKGYESMIADLKGCDVILDEIHTYSSEIQAIVLRIIEVLVNLGCRVHVGTATMPSVLYSKVLELLGGPQNVYEVSLPDVTLDTFNRHIIHKVQSLEDCSDIIDIAITNGQKILVVCNQVKRSQETYEWICNMYPDVTGLLVHSRFKRKDRAELEAKLTNDFNNSKEACIVVSTQVVEVSLDISFDLMITESAPIDALIQRFGRINRKRNKDTIGKFKDIYVTAPPEKGKEALPYNLSVLQRSYGVLPDDEVLQERLLQKMIDMVYPDTEFINIDYSGVCFCDGEWMIKELCHNSKSAFLDLLDINTAVCITESDKDVYLTSYENKMSSLEIPISYKAIAYSNLEQISKKGNPYIIPDAAYDSEKGVVMDKLKPEYYKQFEIL